MRDLILQHLDPGCPWGALLHYHAVTDSTNTQAKLLAQAGAAHGTAVLAGAQTQGRGRLGRSFASPAGMGVYLSVILRPECRPEELMHLTCAVGSAMCDAVQQCAGIRPRIKWTNDLVWGRHKLGGILTQLQVDPATGLVDYAIVGIGINCAQRREDFPAELQDMAISLSMAAEKPISPALLAAHMLSSLYRMDSALLTGKAALLERYRADCMTIGKQIVLCRGDQREYGTALDVCEDGSLRVAFADGTIRNVSSGEVSVRGMYGYV